MYKITLLLTLCQDSRTTEITGDGTTKPLRKGSIDILGMSSWMMSVKFTKRLVLSVNQSDSQ